MQTIGGTAYEKLSVSDQTEIIRQLYLPATTAENLVNILQDNLVQAKEVIAELIISVDDISAILQRIASGTAVGKSEEFLCLAMACGMGCAFPDYQECFGCRYEIFTKSVLHQLVKEFVRLRSLLMTDSDGRYRLILQNSIMPVISEFIETIQHMYPNKDTEELLAIMEGGMRGYDNGIREHSSSDLREASSGE